MNQKYIRQNTHGLYYIPENQLHRRAAQVVAEGKVWESETIDFIIENLNNQSVITAGSYFGDFLPALSKETNQTIFTYEPVPEQFDYAKKTIELNNLKNVVIENLALSDKNGFVTMELCDTKSDEMLLLGGGSRIVSEKSKTTIEVRSTTLDSLIPNDCEISVIHLDVEGHEGKSLEGASRLIKKNLPIIIVESFPEQFFQTYLSPLGYTHQGIVAKNHIIRP